jgi:hypothetical protein
MFSSLTSLVIPTPSNDEYWMKRRDFITLLGGAVA